MCSQLEISNIDAAEVRERSSVELCGPHVAISPAMLRSSNDIDAAEIVVALVGTLQASLKDGAPDVDQVREHSSVALCGPHIAISLVMLRSSDVAPDAGQSDLLVARDALGKVINY